LALSAVVSFTDYKRLIDVMKQIDPKLVKSLRKDFRRIGRPVVRGIKAQIPTQAPLSGMVTKVGRLSWSLTMNQSRDIKSVVVRDRKRAPRSKYPIVGLVQAVVRAAPVALADMSGRSGAYVNSKDETREYDYTGPQKGKPAGQLGRRKHKIRNQGRHMIDRLGGRGSRYVYPGAEASLPQAKAEMQVAVNNAVNNINQMLRNV
jgi:hypothetical protein